MKAISCQLLSYVSRILINFEGLKWNIEFSLSSEQDIENHRFCSETGYRFQDLGRTAPPITLPNTNDPPPPPPPTSGRDTGLIVCLFLCGFDMFSCYLYAVALCSFARLTRPHVIHNLPLKASAQYMCRN